MATTVRVQDGDQRCPPRCAVRRRRGRPPRGPGSLWDVDLIAERRATLDRARALGGRGPYVLQAAIAVLHAAEHPDWPQLAMLYGELARVTRSSVVDLNRAAAIGEAGDARAAYDRALELVHSDAERRFLEQRLAEL